ncbi:hypothetical protein CAPTEDRAFT_193382 [Capitella teleta]|uniref:BRF2-like C-terminal domain-containing protein n=1 Tax=Capitella teleta TaxID=283909 RepID=R7TGM1_CAPTE|nr:hypothetical protein CAPTEDRAFT_193382 [Capitella teleta]|eukprot:ELT90726.1 hypothetical protein CAPTEDRAFT_193382 [Capitella teleta]
MPDKCSHCGKLAVEWEDCDGHGADVSRRRVCHECGTISDEATFTNSAPMDHAPTGFSDEIRHFARSLPSQYALYNSASQHVSRGKKQGLSRMKDVAQTLKCSSALRKQASEIFEKMFHSPKVISERIETKITIAMVCLYLVCRNAMWPITVSDVCDIANCDVGKFVRWSREVTTEMNLQLPMMDIEQIIPSVCPELSREVHEHTKGIIQVCREVFLADGKNPQNVVIAAAYHAWQGSDFINNRKVKLAAFVKKFNLHKNCRYKSSVANLRSRELSKLLIQLASELPWVIEKVDASNYHQHILDVSKHHKTLIREAMSNLLEEEEEKEPLKRKALNEMDLWRNTEAEESKRQRMEKDKVLYERLAGVLDEQLPPSSLNLDNEELCDDDLTKEEAKLYIK